MDPEISIDQPPPPPMPPLPPGYVKNSRPPPPLPSALMKQSGAPPPPPPPLPTTDILSALSQTKIKEIKLKMSRQMGELYMRLKLLMEGQGAERSSSIIGKMANEEAKQALPSPPLVPNEETEDSALAPISIPEVADNTIKDSLSSIESQPTVEVPGLPRLLPSRLLKESSFSEEDQKTTYYVTNELSARFAHASPYFLRIEEDAEKYSQLIDVNIRGEIKSFESNDMTEIVKFRQYLDQRLEYLFDEAKVLDRFDGFPVEKLERIRMAAGRICRLGDMTATINGWKLVSPLEQQLEKIEIYFDKIWREVDEMDLAKDEESKRFKKNNIQFDIGVLITTIKESLVDLSSNCIELTLKENAAAKKAAAEASGSANKVSKMLLRGSTIRRKQMSWRVFQFAYRVYNFARGQDDRADRLTLQLAIEIETLHGC